MPIPRRQAPAFAPPSVLGLLLVAVGCAQLVGLTGDYVEGAGGAGSGGATSGGGGSSQGGGAGGAGQGNSSGMAGSMGQAGSEGPGAGGTSEAGVGNDAGSGGGEPDTGGTAGRDMGGASGVAGSPKGGGNNGGSTSAGRGGSAGNGGASGASAGTGGASAGTGGGSGVGGSSIGGPLVLMAPFVHNPDCDEDMASACDTLPVDCTTFGANKSPELSWTSGPDGTQSYAVSLTELTTGLVFWVIWNIPASTLVLPEGVEKDPTPNVPAGSQQASRGSMEGYYGPGACGNVYEFKVYALPMATFSPTNPTDPEDVVNQLLGLQLRGYAVARGRTSGYCP